MRISIDGQGFFFKDYTNCRIMLNLFLHLLYRTVFSPKSEQPHSSNAQAAHCAEDQYVPANIQIVPLQNPDDISPYAVTIYPPPGKK